MSTEEQPKQSKALEANVQITPSAEGADDDWDDPDEVTGEEQPAAEGGEDWDEEVQAVGETGAAGASPAAEEAEEVDLDDEDGPSESNLAQLLRCQSQEEETARIANDEDSLNAQVAADEVQSLQDALSMAGIQSHAVAFKRRVEVKKEGKKPKSLLLTFFAFSEAAEQYTGSPLGILRGTNIFPLDMSDPVQAARAVGLVEWLREPADLEDPETGWVDIDPGLVDDIQVLRVGEGLEEEGSDEGVHPAVTLADIRAGKWPTAVNDVPDAEDEDAPGEGEGWQALDAETVSGMWEFQRDVTAIVLAARDYVTQPWNENDESRLGIYADAMSKIGDLVDHAKPDFRNATVVQYRSTESE